MSKFVIGLSGTHGTGKSVILNGARDAGLEVSSAQLSRTAQRELGWDTLARAQESVENMWALQNAILNALRKRDLDILASKQHTLAERTPADLWAYTQLWCTRLGIDSATDETAQNYYRDCIALSNAYCSFLILNMHDAVPFVPEPNRADLESRIFVDSAIKAFITEANLPSYTIQNVGKPERIAEAVNFVTIVRSLY